MIFVIYCSGAIDPAVSYCFYLLRSCSTGLFSYTVLRHKIFVEHIVSFGFDVRKTGTVSAGTFSKPRGEMSELSRCHILDKSSDVYQHCNVSITTRTETCPPEQRLDLLVSLVYGHRWPCDGIEFNQRIDAQRLRKPSSDRTSTRAIGLWTVSVSSNANR